MTKLFPAVALIINRLSSAPKFMTALWAAFILLGFIWWSLPHYHLTPNVWIWLLGWVIIPYTCFVTSIPLFKKIPFKPIRIFYFSVITLSAIGWAIFGVATVGVGIFWGGPLFFASYLLLALVTAILTFIAHLVSRSRSGRN